MYCAIIGDIIDSRLIRNRSEIQKKYIEVLDEINEEYASRIASRFKTRDGDGFHGLLSDPESVLEIILKIRLALAPVQIRVGIGIGSISTEIDPYEVQAIDGNAFIIARGAMDDAREKEKKYESIFQQTVLRFERYAASAEYMKSRANAIEELINLNFCTCSLIERGWSEKQAEAIKLKIKGMSQREIAKALNIQQASVYARMKSSYFYTYRYCTIQIQHYISMMWEEQN